MCGRTILILSLATSVVLSLTNPAEAVRRRRYRNYNYNYNDSYNDNYQTYGTGYMHVAPKQDQESEQLRRLPVYYSYERAFSDQLACADKIRVFLMIHDEQILQSGDSLVAQVKIADANDLQTTHTMHCPVTLTPDQDDGYVLGEFEITNANQAEPIVKPARVYRLFVNLHRGSEESGEDSVWGRVPTPYYVATSGDTPLEKARQQIVMQTFKEWYSTERGWSRGGNYAMDCHDYYRWATAPVTVGGGNGRADLNRLFGDNYHNGSHIKDLVEAAAIHGDYVRQPGHTFMLLGYNPKNHEVLTMEGNFNSSIEIAIRPVSSGWTVGHLGEEDIRAELFQKPMRTVTRVENAEQDEAGMM